MNTLAVVLEQPERLALERLALSEPGDEDVVVEIDYSGISTGTEKLLWSGRMPPFPGMGYPLVPGYESVGRVSHAGERSGHVVGETVFVPGARCYGEVRGLFGGTASRVVTAGSRVIPVSEKLGERAVLLALAATAYHAVSGGGLRLSVAPPELIVGHGVLGRLLARMTVLAGGAPVVWERNTARATGAEGYRSRLVPGGEIVLAGFYSEPLSFSFPPAFMREAQIRAAAEWKRPDMLAVKHLVDTKVLSLDGLITHHERATAAEPAFRTAFADAGCLKMVLDWRGCA